MTDLLWINLDKDVARKDHMNLSINTAFTDASCSRIRACDPLDVAMYDIIDNDCPIPVSVGEHGCLLSHMKCIEMGIESSKSKGNDHFMVTEDDIMFEISPLSIKSICDSAPDDWEILQLYSNNANAVLSMFFKDFGGGGPGKPNDVIWKKWDFSHWSTAAYIIKVSTAEDLVKRFKFSSTDMKIDLRCHSMKSVADLVLYMFNTTYTLCVPIATTLDVDSNIHPEHIDMHRSATRSIRSILFRLKKKDGPHSHPFLQSRQ